jgi:hypothetical protein
MELTWHGSAGGVLFGRQADERPIRFRVDERESVVQTTVRTDQRFDAGYGGRELLCLSNL